MFMWDSRDKVSKEKEIEEEKKKRKKQQRLPKPIGSTKKKHTRMNSNDDLIDLLKLATKKENDHVSNSTSA